jgi:RHS repeat-associated protein
MFMKLGIWLGACIFFMLLVSDIAIAEELTSTRLRKVKPEKNVVATSFVFAGNQLLMSVEDKHEEKYYLTDHLGSVSIILDRRNDIIANYSYFDFGASRNLGVDRYRYSSKELDFASNIYYYGARYYDAEIGRFTTADSVNGRLGNPQSFNKYVYVLNNPLRYVDPSGNIEFEATKFKGLVDPVADSTKADFIRVATSQDAVGVYEKHFKSMGFTSLDSIPDTVFVDFDRSVRPPVGVFGPLLHHDPTNDIITIGSDPLVTKKNGGLTDFGKTAAVHEVSHKLFYALTDSSSGLHEYTNLASNAKSGDIITMSFGKYKETVHAKINLENKGHDAQIDMIKKTVSNPLQKNLMIKAVEQSRKTVVGSYQNQLNYLNSLPLKDNQILAVKVP